MNQTFPIENSQFFTATIYKCPPGLNTVRTGNHLLADNNHKNIIVNCLKFLVSNKRIELNAFVIMSNHIHVIWQPLSGFTTSTVQASFMKFTAKQLLLSQLRKDVESLSNYKVNKYDRDYQIWKREPLSIDLVSETLFKQKFDYIHFNPVTAGLCFMPEDYFYSSANFYLTGIDTFGMLTHFSGN